MTKQSCALKCGQFGSIPHMTSYSILKQDWQLLTTLCTSSFRWTHMHMRTPLSTELLLMMSSQGPHISTKFSPFAILGATGRGSLQPNFFASTIGHLSLWMIHPLLSIQNAHRASLAKHKTQAQHNMTPPAGKIPPAENQATPHIIPTITHMKTSNFCAHSKEQAQSQQLNPRQGPEQRPHQIVNVDHWTKNSAALTNICPVQSQGCKPQIQHRTHARPRE